MPPSDLDKLRTRQADALGSELLDVLIVGGGIVGAGVARDAALRGLRTGLVEQQDLAFGTSSRTSRLLHGGLRYLAQGRLGLVYEASREKRILHRIAPHLAEPLAFIFPTYRGSGWPQWKLRLGVRIYDSLCGGQNLGPSSSLTADEVLHRLPQPKSHGLTGGVRYFDALTNDARLVLDTLRSASRQGALVANYTRLEEARPAGPGWRCTVRDVLTGQTYDVAARSVVHATGPWAQQLPQSSIRLRLTKGVHLVVERRRLPVADAVVMARGSRILFAIPWRERVILGTTDTDYEGPIEAPQTEPADVDYILDAANDAFPFAAIDRTDVVSTWAGLRPLIAGRRGGPSDISRAHLIRSSQSGWIDVAGGKLTTYRLIAQQVVDRVVDHLGRPPVACRTAQLPLLEEGEVAGLSGVGPPEITGKIVEHCCREEWAVHLDDVMLRRTGWQFYYRDRRPIAERAAGWMAEILGWDHARHDAELARWQEQVH
jgi:glycerol-3-phosphate dehydrogenase